MATRGSSILVFFISFILIRLVRTTTAQPDFQFNICSDSGNYSSNSTYKANLNTLLSSISSNTEIDYGFYNFSTGENSDKVNAIALCRGDLNQEDCLFSVFAAVSKLTKVCPNQKEAIGWYDKCMLRYSNRSIFGTVTETSYYMWNTNNISNSNVDDFNTALATLLGNLRTRAASGDSRRKFATGETNLNTSITVYALVQCTPDLSQLQCGNCLEDAFSYIPACCDGKQGGRVIGPSCNLRYEIYKFYDSTADAIPPPSSPSPPPANSSPPLLTNRTDTPGKESNTSRTAIIIVVSTASSIILIVCICIFQRKRKRREKVEKPVDEIRTMESLQIDFDTIRVATDNFSDANKLGQGGFGAVYKGTLSNGQEIAVKRLSMTSAQGEVEFKNEVLLVAKLQHRNLVRLLGFSLKGNERLLIYEFVPNTSLDHFIFDPTNRAQLDWERRYKIIGGIARGLLYLHEDSRLRIIHRDLKASNVLLDAEMYPKISDFGMARLFTLDQTQGNTSRIVGTYGYMAPEYAMHGDFSIKSDVYSFGVLVLEIVSGQRNRSLRNRENVEDLMSYAWKSWMEGTASNLLDPTLTTGSRTDMIRCMHIGLLCVQDNVANRPTMALVVLMLSSHSLALPVPSEPAFFSRSSMDPEMPLLLDHNSGTNKLGQSENEIVCFSINEASITELEPR